MFDALTEKLTGVFDTLTGRGALSSGDVEAALREVRLALLDADVALPVVKAFIAKVKEEAVGEKVIRAVKPGQQVVKIVYDALVDTLGGEDGPVDGPAQLEQMRAGVAAALVRKQAGGREHPVEHPVRRAPADVIEAGSGEEDFHASAVR